MRKRVGYGESADHGANPKSGNEEGHVGIVVGERQSRWQGHYQRLGIQKPNGEPQQRRKKWRGFATACGEASPMRPETKLWLGRTAIGVGLVALGVLLSYAYFIHWVKLYPHGDDPKNID